MKKPKKAGLREPAFFYVLLSYQFTSASSYRDACLVAGFAMKGNRHERISGW